MDVKKDFLENWNNKNTKNPHPGRKCGEAVKIIDEFCKPTNVKSPFSCSIDAASTDEERENSISDKIKVLIEMLNNSHQAKTDVKTIIFVKDRSVAVYLKRLLSGNDKKSGDSSFLGQGLLDPEKFKVDYAMGCKSKSIVNKAYKSLNTE